MTVANTNGAGAVVNGESGGGAGLPTAAGADEVPVSTGAGTTYTATPLAAAVGDTLADLYGALDAGDFYVSDGAGVVPASSVPATVRGVIGIGQPTTLAAQAQADTLRRRGPVALVGTTTAGILSQSATADSTPSILLGTSGVITYYNATVGGGTGGQPAFAASWGSSGWAIESGINKIVLAFPKASIQRATMATPSAGIGWHSVAWMIAADGLSVRYSFDGAAVTTASLSSSPLAPVARTTATVVQIGTNSSGAGIAPDGISYLGIWELVLDDDALRAAAASPENGAPTLPSTPAWEWAAAPFAGAEVVTIGGVAYTRSGSPTMWMP